MSEPLDSFTERLCTEQEIVRWREVASHLFRALEGCLPPEQVDPSQGHTALNVVGGTGEWALAVAQASPSMFVQDVQSLLAARFPEQSFDLINMALLAPAMLTLDYQALVRTLLPLGRPGGMVRWTEMEFPMSSSPAFEELTTLTCRALQAAGHTFVPPVFQELDALFAQWRDEQGMPAHPIERHHLGITPMMGSWLRNAGYQHVRYVPTAIEVSYGTEAHGWFVHAVEYFAQHIQPFLLAQGVIATDDYEPLLAAVHDDLHQESFCGLCMLLTVCARIP